MIEISQANAPHHKLYRVTFFKRWFFEKSVFLSKPGEKRLLHLFFNGLHVQYAYGFGFVQVRLWLRTPPKVLWMNKRAVGGY